MLPAEQLRPQVARRREQWKKSQGRLDPARLVFIDETWAKTNMAPLRGWAPVGKRLHAKVPYGHWRTMTFLAALRTKVKHPWTNGQVERMNRTIKEATVKRYHYDSHDQLTAHLHAFIDAYNYGRRLKTLRGLTPYEYICKTWTSDPDRFTTNPHQLSPGLNT